MKVNAVVTPLLHPKCGILVPLKYHLHGIVFRARVFPPTSKFNLNIYRRVFPHDQTHRLCCARTHSPIDRQTIMQLCTSHSVSNTTAWVQKMSSCVLMGSQELTIAPINMTYLYSAGRSHDLEHPNKRKRIDGAAEEVRWSSTCRTCASKLFEELWEHLLAGQVC